MSDPPPSSGYVQAPPSRPAAVVLTVLAGAWLVAVTAVPHAVLWLVEGLQLQYGLALPLVTLPVVGAGAAAIGALPALIVSVLSRVDFARQINRLWVVAAVCGALLGGLRLVHGAYQDVYLLLLALAAAVLAIVPVSGSGGRSGRPALALVPLSLAIGLASLIPWLALGSLGGLVETVAAALAALAIGWLASRRLGGLATVGQGIASRWGRGLVAGLALGTGLVALLSGVGLSGVQLLALLAVPPLAFAAVSTGRLGPASLTPLVGLAVFGPLAFTDSEELSLIMGVEDAGYWSLVGALAAVGIALVLGIVAITVLGGGLRPRWWVSAGLAIAVAAGAGTVYIGPGHAGLHGDRIFVVLKEQADLAGLDTMTDRAARLTETYRRLVDTADRSQGSIRDALRDRGIAFTPFYLVNGLEVDAGPLVRQWLAGRDDVDRVLFNPVLRPLPRPPTLLSGSDSRPDGPQWNLTLIDVDHVRDEFKLTGVGIVIGTSDSGVDSLHEQLSGNLRPGDDSWLDPVGGSPSPVDYNGHGTHTLATAVGQDVGVAPGATWVACANLPRATANPATYLACLQFMLAPYPAGADPLRAGRPERAPHILTNSWACPEFEGCDAGALRRATAVFAAAGVFFVAAAGNSGPLCRSITDPPAIYADAVTVGAIDEDGNVTEFSSLGPAPGGGAKPDLVAPGAGVLSALPGGRYGRLDGTSMATPHVAGVVALMWAANPKLIGDIRTTRSLLLGSVTKPSDAEVEFYATDSCGPHPNATGAGIVNALVAVRAAVRAR